VVTYLWSSSPTRCLGCFGHFVSMRSLLTFLFHTSNISFFCLISFDKFWQGSMWGHYGSKIVRVFLGPLSKALGLITDIVWQYKFSLYGGLCFIYFFMELSYDGFVFVLWISYFWHTCLGGIHFSGWRGPTFASIMLMCNVRWPSSYN